MSCKQNFGFDAGENRWEKYLQLLVKSIFLFLQKLCSPFAAVKNGARIKLWKEYN